MSDPAATSRSSARARLEAALARIADPEGEGGRACLTVYADAARAAADASDARAGDGATFGPLDGVIVTIKDLFDELDQEVFWQIHRATIVNLNAIARVERDWRDQPVITLKSRPEKLTVSRTFAHRFKTM